LACGQTGRTFRKHAAHVQLDLQLSWQPGAPQRAIMGLAASELERLVRRLHLPV
jgi:hypothetical protein